MKYLKFIHPINAILWTPSAIHHFSMGDIGGGLTRVIVVVYSLAFFFRPEEAPSDECDYSPTIDECVDVLKATENNLGDESINALRDSTVTRLRTLIRQDKI